MKKSQAAVWRRGAALGLAGLAMVCLFARAGRAADSLCAEVKIEIRQELTLERQAFDAHMRINNGLDNMDMANIGVEVTFQDADDNVLVATSDPANTNAAFFIVVDTLENVGDVEGTGTVAARTSADIHWLIIPAPGTGGSDPRGTKYFVGAVLSYRLGGADQQMEVQPDTIFVRPMPVLVLDYFLPRDVYADDAFTDLVEPPVPFSLGVRVANNGYGPAQALKIDSGQPTILENETGLLIGFRITGSEVNGDDFSESLLVEFGDIAPNDAGVARWVMECSLSGEFKSFRADFSHADELGGELTSLIEEVNTHELVHDVLVDLPGRDGVRDFLAVETGYTVYESDNLEGSVVDRSSASLLELVTDLGEYKTYSLTVPATPGTLYVQTDMDSTDWLEIVSVMRSDGKNMDLANAWFSKTRETGTDPWEHFFNLFDSDGGGIYTVIMRSTGGDPQPPVLAYIGDKIGFIGDPLGLGFLVEATDANGTVPELLTTRLPPGSTFVRSTNGLVSEGSFSWTPASGQEGVYPVKFSASDGEFSDEELIRIYVGLEGEGTNSMGVPLSLADWSVGVTNVDAAATATTARVEWDAVEGLTYDLYSSEGPFSSSMVWQVRATNLTVTAGTNNWVDPTVDSGLTERFYQVVLSGMDVTGNGAWGIIRRAVPAQSYQFFAAPLRSDLKMSGDFGSTLAEVLDGHDGGPGDGLGDELYVLNSDGSWNVLYLDASGVWRNGSGTASTLEIQPGDGMILARNQAAEAGPLFAGEVGNDGTRECVFNAGWNLKAISEGRDVPVQTAFANVTQGTGPVGGSVEAESDRIVFWDADGIHLLMFVDGWGAPFDGQWVDLVTLEVTERAVSPGQAFYYYRQATGGSMTIAY